MEANTSETAAFSLAPGAQAADPKLVEALTEHQRATLTGATPTSGERFKRAKQHMPGGVPSSFQMQDPWPTYIERGKGADVWDVDGRRYTDFHNGFGVMCVGHANDTIAVAVAEQVRLGTHFAAPTDGSIAVAEELNRRFGLPLWRFTNSGTESTMDAVHLSRGLTGRDMILKIEGSYHGHHDSVMISVYPELGQLGDRDDPVSVPYGMGYPKALTDLTRSVPFNDAEVLESVLDRWEGKFAGMIMEPAMMNINVVKPVDGYLERVRELTRKHGVMLIFDEVKTGATIAAGGATQRFGVTPDFICLAKATMGGLPGGAIGMTEDAAQLIREKKVHQYGTFNGNPLVMAAAEACLTRVLTDEAYAKLEATNQAVMGGCDEIIAKYKLPAHTVGMGAKGCVIFSTEPIREYRDYLTKIDGSLAELAWLYHMNHGVFMTPGVEEEWTLSIAHEDEHVEKYLNAFEAFAKDLTGASA